MEPMTETEFAQHLKHGHEVLHPLTLLDDKTNLPTRIAYPDGTFLVAAPSNVGKEIFAEGRPATIVWDGGMPCPRGGHTKGQLLDEFKSRDSLHTLRELYAKHGVPQPQVITEDNIESGE